jgi:sugar phosphate isomerase/epimerase
MLYCLGKPFKKMTEQLLAVKTKYVEIVDDGFHTLNKRRVAVLKDIANSHGLEYTVHAPFADINIASLSKPMLRAMLKRLEQSIVHASALDSHVWVFHPGMKTGISSFYPNMDWLQNMETVKTLLQIARENDLKIAIENVPEPFPFLMKSVEDFARFYAGLGENMGMVLDVGHANLNRQIESLLETFSNRIVHMHLSDNDGKHDQHLGIGHGTIDWDRVLGSIKKMPYGEIIIVESVERVEESVARIEQLLA